MEEVAFFAGAIGALGGAIAVIALRNPFYCVLALVVHLVSLAGLFLILHAEFVAAAQVVVYAGAIVVLYVFVAAYVGGIEEPLWEPIPGQRLIGPLLAGGAVRRALDRGARQRAVGPRDRGRRRSRSAFGSPEAIGELFLERFLIAFEAASILLLVGAVGAVVLAGKRAAPSRAGGRGGLMDVSWYIVLSALLFASRRRRRADPPQPARDPALPRADAQRGQPRAARLRAHARRPGRPGLRTDRDGRRGLRGRRRARPDRRDVPAPHTAQRRRPAEPARDERHDLRLARARVPARREPGHCVRLPLASRAAARAGSRPARSSPPSSRRSGRCSCSSTTPRASAS